MNATYEERQNSLGWYRARLGMITGSAVGQIMGTPKSKSQKFTTTAESYLQQVAFERSMDHAIVDNDDLFMAYIDLTSPKSKAMDWGHAQEENAANLFAILFHDLYEPSSESFKLSLEEPPSVRCKDIQHFASSPDRMFTNPVTGEICCLEIKSPMGKAFTKYASIISLPEEERMEALKKAESTYYWQIYAHMLATGTHTCYWAIYNPFSPHPLFAMQVSADEEVIETLRARIIEADEYVEDLCKMLR